MNVAGNSGAGAPTGTVTVNLDGNPLGTYALDPNGNASVLSGAMHQLAIASTTTKYSNVPTIVAGGHTLTASYSGDGTFNATTATPVPITVNPITPTITLTAGATQITSGFS